MRRVIVILVLIAVFFVAAIPMLGSAQGTAGSAGGAGGANTAQSAVRRATVDKGEVQLTIGATGKIVVDQQANLSFDQSGQVQEVLVKEGQQVQAGQLLARLDDSTQQLSLSQANDAVTAAQAALQKVLSPVDAGTIAKAEANVKAAQASYSGKANGTNMDTIKSNELQVQKA